MDILELKGLEVMDKVARLVRQLSGGQTGPEEEMVKMWELIRDPGQYPEEQVVHVRVPLVKREGRLVQQQNYMDDRVYGYDPDQTARLNQAIETIQT